MIRGRIWELEEQRPQNRQTCARCFIGKRVEIWHELITRLDEAATNCFMLRATDPWLLVAGSLFRMVAIDGLKGSDFEPLRQQIWIRCSRVASNVGACEGEAADSQ